MAGFSKPSSVMSVLLAFFALLQITVAAGHGHRHHARHADAAIQAQIDEVNEALVERSGFTKRDIGPFVRTSGVCSTGVMWWGDCNDNGRASFPRREIRDLRNDADQWNLYLLGMERFMSKSKSDRLSYYQVAGIHGRPFTSYDSNPLMNQAGYCPHGQVLFGSWHRPYLAIFEQAWYLAVTEVVKEFPDNVRQRWWNAANVLRMPYWDWAQDPNGGPTVPTLIRDQYVTVTKPQGQVTIENPLYSYSWGSSLPNEMGGGPWDNFPRTLRRPVANPTRSNNNEMNARFDSMRTSLRDRVFALFSSRDSWGYVSTSQIGARTDLSGSGVDSFESVHDAVHNTAGGDSGGHMYYLDVSSFDPIFWLHHTNIDRLLAMYQFVRSDTYVAIGQINRPMAQWNEGDTVHGGTPLVPFRKSTYGGSYYNSDDVRETRNLGYYYPETRDRSYSQVAQAVTNLYGAGVRTFSKRDNTNSQTGQYLGRPFEEGDYHTVATITADKFAMDGSYTVHCFIGNDGNSTVSNSTAPFGNSTSSYKPTVSSTPQQKNSTRLPEEDYDPSQDFTQSPDYVGAYGVLGGMKSGGNSSNPLITRGSIPLTTCLQGKQYYGKLKSLDPKDVEPYLAKNFYYKVIGRNGEIDPKTIPNFHISVQCTKVTPAKNGNSLPDLSGAYTVLPDATKNVPAGTPYTYTPKPNDYVSPDPRYSSGYGSGSGSSSGNGSGTSQNPSQYWMGSNGQCAVQQVIKYVYPDGKPVSY